MSADAACHDCGSHEHAFAGNHAPHISGPAVVELRNVGYSYDGTPVVEDASLDILAREFVSLVGPNGGGKTTLLKIMLGLLRPARGSVRILGQPPERARRRIGYMPQRAQLDPRFPVTVDDVVLMGRLGRTLLGPYRRADREAAHAALRQVRLDGLGRRSFSALSGGQRQRVLIARALACDPEILLLDEPTANLDPGVQDDFHELLHELNQRLTIVIVSHDTSFVSKFVQRVVCVNRRVVTHRTSEISPELLRELYAHDVHAVLHSH